MTGLTSTPRRARLGSPIVGGRAAIAIAAVLAMTPTTLFAEAQVHGSPEAVSIEANNTPIEEILAALGNAFDVHYQSSANLGKQITGTYKGSLPRVVMRLLEGYNFVIMTSNERIEIAVLGTRNAPAVAGASRASTISRAVPIPPAPPALASTSSKVAEQPAAATPAAQPAPAIKVAEPPVPDAFSGASSPAIRLAEGPMPPVPSPSLGSAPGPVPEAQPSTVAPPAPLAAGSALTNVPQPQPSAVPPPTAADTAVKPPTGRP